MSMLDEFGVDFDASAATHPVTIASNYTIDASKIVVVHEIDLAKKYLAAGQQPNDPGNTYLSGSEKVKELTGAEYEILHIYIGTKNGSYAGSAPCPEHSTRVVLVKLRDD